MGGWGISFRLGLVLALLFAGPAASEQPYPLSPPLPDDLREIDAGHVVSAEDGQTLRLQDGRILRLAGIQAPQPPLGWQAGEPGRIWRRSADATATLDALAKGRGISLYGPGRTLVSDRHDRLLAQAVRDDGLWLQGALLVAGMAWVYTTSPGAGRASENDALVGALYAAEDLARLAGLGIWADPYYAVRCAGDLNNATDAVRVVQGRILAVADINGALYLNFGADWRRDFTIRVERRDRRRLGWSKKPLMLDGAALQGALMEVRGWVYWFNGPAIDLDHGARLRPLAEGSKLAIPACDRNRD